MEKVLTPADVFNFIQKWRVYRDDVTDPSFKSDDEIYQMQNALLQRQMKRLSAGSKYYQKIFHGYGIDPESIKTIDDLGKMPLTRKSDYMVDPDAFRLSFTESRVENNLWEVSYTTGTTAGKPSPFYVTVFDMYSAYLAGMRMFKVAMVSPMGINVNLYPFGPLPHIGYTRFFSRSAGLGRPWVSPSIGMKNDEIPIHRSLDFAIDLIESWKSQPLLIQGIPSFIRRLIIKAEQERRDFSSITDIHFGGEPFNKQARDDLRMRMANIGAKDVKITNIYGFTELQTSTAECCEFAGSHFTTLDLHFFEVVDEEGRRLPDGETGYLAITHLNARGTSLVRFFVGDQVKMTHEPCPYCGRRGGRLLPTEGTITVTRQSEILNVKGTLMNPNILKEGLLGITEIGEYQIVVDLDNPLDPLSSDVLTIKLFTEAKDREKLKADVVHMCRNAVEMTPRVEFVESAAAIYDIDTTYKSVRVIDRRPKQAQ
jgi:phenylacetate-CoA ligase